MKISYNWLMDYINQPVDINLASELLTDCGLEVESIEKYETLKGGLAGVFVGEVIQKEKHPNADKLSLTKVNIGTNEILSIVCGAPNVEAGQKVLVATIGTKLPTKDGDFEIKSSKIRGELSQGMICAEDELGIGESHAGIMVLEPSTKVGITAKEFFNLYEDNIFEIGLTPNRADAASHFGVARDLVAVLNSRSKGNFTLLKPNIDKFSIDNTKIPISIEVPNEKACTRYTGLSISGVNVKESPNWLQNKLKAIGLRPINNIVDVTNYILHELGQPLHAFDAEKIKGNKVIVKTLSAGTPFITLDGVERKLTNEDLMICNTEEPMCIAGVFGGITSSVTKETKNIFLESACFNPVYVRKTSKHHTLKTDASFRFERGTDPNITIYAIKRAALLIKEIAGGEISSEIIDVYPNPVKNFEIEFSFHNLNRLAGKEINKEICKYILKSLEITIQKESDEKLILSVPPFKVDVQREADVIEEVLRVYGYNNIELPKETKISIHNSSKPDRLKMQQEVANFLTSNGFNETMSNSLTKSVYFENNPFINPENLVKILNPISKDLEIMRPTLLYAGLETIIFNQNRQKADLKIYEFGKIYLFNNENRKSGDPLNCYKEEMHLSLFLTGKIQQENWYNKEAQSNFFQLKAFVENIFEKSGVLLFEPVYFKDKYNEFCYSILYKINNIELARIGKIDNNIIYNFDIKNDVFFADINWDNIIKTTSNKKTKFCDIPKFPEVRRDLALLLNKTITYEEIKNVIEKNKIKYLKKINLFDVYEGKNIDINKKSYAISFIMQNSEKTLTDSEIDANMQKIIKILEKELSATLR